MRGEVISVLWKKLQKQTKNNLSFNSSKFFSVILLFILYFYCYLSIDPSHPSASFSRMPSLF